MTVAELQDVIRDAGLRVTGPRVAVLQALHAEHDHPRVEQIRERVEHSGVSISPQAAYDACEALHNAGLARKLHVAGAPVRYEARIGDNHHHLICRSCGSTIDVDCAHGSAPCLDPGDKHGFVLEEAEVTYWGVCPECQKQSQ